MCSERGQSNAKDSGKFLLRQHHTLKTSGRVQRYEHIELKDKGLSNRFIHGIHGVLRSALEQAVKERLITSNPADGCKLPKSEKKEMKVLLPEQIGAYLQEANRCGLLPAYYLELTSGLRRGELLALLWTDLDVENMTISVTKQVNRINGQLKVSQPKTHNSIRTIPIPKQAVDLLILEHENVSFVSFMIKSSTLSSVRVCTCFELILTLLILFESSVSRKYTNEPQALIFDKLPEKRHVF